MAMNRRRAYRQLLSRSSSRSSIISTYENYAFHDMMADKLRKSVPIVKLKIGEPLSTTRRGHTVVELNNVRANYSNYCHYRMASAGKKEFPPLQGRRSSSPTRDTRVVLLLKGTEKKDRKKKLGAAGDPTSFTHNSLVDQSLNSGSQTLSGHIIVKRKDTISPKKSMEVNFPTAPNSEKSTDGVDGYELRGNSLFKSPTPDLRGEELYGSGHRLPIRASNFVDRHPTPPDRNRNGRFVPRPGSYVTNTRRYREMFNYENDHHPVPSYTSRERKTRYEGRCLANMNTYVFPVAERALRISSAPQPPHQLTQKNLEIFDYLQNPKNELGLSAQCAGDAQVTNERVLNWIQERQVDMATIIQEVMNENLATHGQPSTPEMTIDNEERPVADEEDPDLEVYDLTHHNDYHSQDEVIDEVHDDLSSNAH